MASNETTVSGDVLYQNGDDLSEANITRSAARSNATDYVERGLSVVVDAAAGTIDIGSGHCIVQDGIHAFDVFPNQITDISLPAPNGTNHVYLVIDETVDDDIAYHVDDDDTPPANPSLKIATADGDAGTSTPVNPRPDVQLGDTDIQRLVAALDANGQDIQNVGTLDGDLVSTSVNNTVRVQPTDDLVSVVANDLTAGDHLIIDTGDTTDAHAVDSTVTFSVPCSIEFRGYVKPTGDFTAIELNNVSGTYTIYPKGREGFVVSDDDGVTTAGSHGFVTHNGYQMATQGRADGFGGHGVFQHQASSGDKLNHCIVDWLIGSTGGNGFRNENTTGNASNVNGHYGRVQVFGSESNGVEMVDGTRNRMTVVGASGTGGNSALNEGDGAGKNLYWLEEEGWGNNPSVNSTSRLWVLSSDNISQGGWHAGNPRRAVTFRGSDGVLDVEAYYEFHCDSGSPHTFSLPSDAPQARMPSSRTSTARPTPTI